MYTGHETIDGVKLLMNIDDETFDGVKLLMNIGHEPIDVCRSRNNAMPCLAPGSLSPDT